MGYYDFPHTRNYDTDLGYLIDWFKANKNKIEENTAITIEKALSASEEAIKAYNSATNASNSAELALVLKNQTEALKNLMQDKIDQIDTNTNRINNLATIDPGSITSTADAELVDIRVGDNGITYPNAGDSVRGQISELKSDLVNIASSNVLYKSEMETVSGTTWALKDINITDGIVVGEKYTVLIDKIIGGTAPHLCYIRCMANSTDTNSNALYNVGTGTATEKVKATITAVEGTTCIRVTLYASTTTALPTGSATYTGITIVKGESIKITLNDDLEYKRLSDDETRISKLEKNYVTVGSAGCDYTMIIDALKNTPDNTKLIITDGVYDIFEEYKSYYGNDFWTLYTGYSGNSDKFMRGLWLGVGREIECEECSIIKFEPPTNEITDAIQDFFSVIVTSTDNAIKNAYIKFRDCRYAVHDDYAEINAGTNIYDRCVFDGYAHFGAVIGGGCGVNNVYIFTDCIFKNIDQNYNYCINYHNNNGRGETHGKNKIIVKNCIGDGRVRFKWYGSFTDVSECIVSGSKFKQIDCIAHESTPNTNVNMELYQFNNTIG